MSSRVAPASARRMVKALVRPGRSAPETVTSTISNIDESIPHYGTG